MSTLLLRISGPMQAWGTQDRFGVRFSEREPTKSGVVGMICAALGRPRTAPVDDLGDLRFGIRAEREGVLQRDYHTAGGTRQGEQYGVLKADGGSSKNAVLSWRYYLADADFLVGLEGEDDLLTTIESAVRLPTWQIFLGRKAFVPGLPVYFPSPGGLRRGASLSEALALEPWPLPSPVPRDQRQRPQQLRLVLECTSDESTEARNDQPYGAAFLARTFAPRYVMTTFRTLGTEIPLREDEHVPVSPDPQLSEP